MSVAYPPWFLSVAGDTCPRFSTVTLPFFRWLTLSLFIYPFAWKQIKMLPMPTQYVLKLRNIYISDSSKHTRNVTSSLTVLKLALNVNKTVLWCFWLLLTAKSLWWIHRCTLFLVSLFLQAQRLHKLLREKKKITAKPKNQLFPFRNAGAQILWYTSCEMRNLM